VKDTAAIVVVGKEGRRVKVIAVGDLTCSGVYLDRQVVKAV